MGVNHPDKAAQFISNETRAHWHDQALWYMRAKRDRMAHGVPEWETLREIAAQIKAHTMSKLPYYLEMFEENVIKLGAKVHWARHAEEHNKIVYRILKDKGVHRVVKSKSMLTEECHLNPFLESRGIEVVDTDLGERIVQLAKEPPSHIVVPAIHKKKEEIGELFHQHLNTKKGASDPIYLTESARGHLREKFLKAEAGITGVNFAIAETGGLVICTNEGNADMGTSLPPLHIACMGFEKLIPRTQDLGVFLRLLARSATGQPITTYSSHFHGPMPGSELHIVIVDNGRSQILQSEEFKRSLSCIRCGACLNTCPVYRRSGGHSYGFTIPGPIGSILAPAYNPKKYWSLPHASSLCGSCTDVCPVKIDLHHQLLAWRKELTSQGLLPFPKRIAMKIAGLVFRHTWAYEWSWKMARWIVPKLPRFAIYNGWNTWGKQRELPPFPKESFREMYKKKRAQESEARSQKSEAGSQ